MKHYSRIREQTWVRVYKTESLTKQEGRCAYCHEPLSCAQATGDHVVSRYQGGSTSAKNIKACCQSCNKTKGSMGEKAFKSLIRNPPEDHPKRFFFLMANARWRIFRRGALAERNIRRAAK